MIKFGGTILYYFILAILTMPYQLGIKWFAMGWLVEAILMIIYGYKKTKMSR